MSFANQFLRTDISHIFFLPPSSDKNLSGRGLSSLVLWWSFIIDKADSKLTHNWVRMIISIESVTILLWVYFPSSTFIHQTSPPSHMREALSDDGLSKRLPMGIIRRDPRRSFLRICFQNISSGILKTAIEKGKQPFELHPYLMVFLQLLTSEKEK